MKKFELLKHEVFSEVVEHTYTLQDETGVLIYKEWVDKGQVIDFVLRDKDGNDIGDAELFDQVMEFVDNLEQQ